MYHLIKTKLLYVSIISEVTECQELTFWTFSTTRWQPLHKFWCTHWQKFGGQLELQDPKGWILLLWGESEKLGEGLTAWVRESALVVCLAGGVMSARQKHRALNGITQGDVNLGRTGGELNMIRGLQRDGWKRGWSVKIKGLRKGETIQEGKMSRGLKDCNSIYKYFCLTASYCLCIFNERNHICLEAKYS